MATLRAEIQTVLKDQGLVDAKGRIDELEKEVGKLEKRLESASEESNKFAEGLAELVMTERVFEIIKSGVEDFAKLERGFNALAYGMRGMGLDAEKEVPRVKEFLEAIESAGGPLLTETLPAFQKFIGITKDTTAAMYAVKLAADMAESGQLDMAGATDALAAIMQGRAKSAAQSLGLQLKDVNGHVKTNDELLEEAIKKYEGLGEAMQDTEKDLRRAGATWEEAKRTIGEGFSKLAGLLEPVLFHAVAAVKDLGAVFGWLANNALAALHGIGDGISAAFDFKTLLKSPGEWFANLGKVAEDTNREMADADKILSDQLIENHTRVARHEEDVTAGVAKVREIAHRNALAAEEKAADEAGKKAAEHARKKAEQEERAAQAAVEAEIRAAKDGSDERLALEMKLLDMKEAAELRKAKETGASLDAIHESYRTQRAAKDAEYAKARHDATLRAEDELLKARIDKEKEGSAARLALEQQALKNERDRRLVAAKGSKDAELAIEAAYQIAKAALEQKYREKTDDAELKSAIATDAILIKAEKAAAQEELQAALHGAGDRWAALRKVNDAGFKEQRTAARQALRQELKDAGDNDTLRAQAYKRFQQKMLAIDKEVATAEEKLRKEKVQSEEEAGLAICDASIAFAKTAFGNSKAVASAEAIMHGAQAIMGIMDKWAWMPAVEAALIGLTVAETAAQVAKINSADPTSGSGFDDPANDTYARDMGGRRWARDLVNQIGTGFRSELGQLSPFPAAAGGPTTLNQSGDTFNFHGELIDETSLRHFMRRARRVERRDGARFQK